MGCVYKWHKMFHTRKADACRTFGRKRKKQGDKEDFEKVLGREMERRNDGEQSCTDR